MESTEMFGLIESTLNWRLPWWMGKISDLEWSNRRTSFAVRMKDKFKHRLR